MSLIQITYVLEIQFFLSQQNWIPVWMKSSYCLLAEMISEKIDLNI